MRRLIPLQRSSSSPALLKRIARLIGAYRFWRSRGNSIRASWWLARNTL